MARGANRFLAEIKINMAITATGLSMNFVQSNTGDFCMVKRRKAPVLMACVTVTREISETTFGLMTFSAAQ